MVSPNATLLYYNQRNPDLIDPRFDILKEPEDLIQFAGRWDYGPNSIAKFGSNGIIGRWITAGEESMVEMGDATFFIECSRVVSHEIVRHRIASYQQESQRYVKYQDETVDSLFIRPPEFEGDYDASVEFDRACAVSLTAYKYFMANGGKAQIARYVLPNATRTRLIMKANFREWRHYLKLRCHTSAQPEMRGIAWQIHDQLVGKFPDSFGDIKPFLEAGERQTR